MATPPAVDPALPPTTESGQLHRKSLGVASIVFFIVAAAAPLTAVAGGQAVSYLVTGNKAIPFFYLPFALILILFVLGYAAMSRHIANAGAFYSYVARGMSRVGGVGTAFVAFISYNAMQVGIYGLFGVAFGAFMADKAGITMEWYWWCFIAWGIIAVLGLLQVDLNAKVLAVLLCLEILVVFLFDVAIVGDPGPDGITFKGFSPSIAFEGAVGASLAFVMAAFTGFESAALYSEEAKDPKRTVARATFIGVGVVAGFYAISSWLLGVSVTPEVITNPELLIKGGFVGADPNAPDPTTVLFITGADRLGAFWGDAATLLFATSLFAALISFHNAVARYTFALGREQIFPRAFDKVSARTGSPWAGSLTQTLIAFTALFIFAVLNEDPILKLFTWFTNLGATGVLLLLGVTSFAVVGFFQKHPEDQTDAGKFATLYAPLVAGSFLLIIFVVVLLNFNVLITSAQDAPTDKMSIILPAVLIGGGIIGILYGLYLKSAKPKVYEWIGQGPRAEVHEPGAHAQAED